MRTFNKILLIAFTMTTLPVLAKSGASKNVSAAGKHSALAVAHGTVASAQVGSAVIAVPLMTVGSVGKVSMVLGDQLMTSAISNKPLEVTDKTVTKAPSPAKMMKTNQEGTL